MSRAEAQKEILEPMQRLFLPPRDFDEAMQKSVLAEYAEALDGFGSDDLRAAWVEVRNEHKTRAWPVIGVFVAAAGRARHEREALSGASKARHQDAQRGGWKAWLEALKSDKARQAAERGVAWAFKCAILSGTPLKDIDLDRLVRGKQFAETLASRMERDLPIFASDGRDIGVVREPNKAMLLSMWYQMAVNEGKTQEEIGVIGGQFAPPADFEAAHPF